MNNIVEAILSNLATLLPWRIVHTYERGVKFRRGRVQMRALDPGWHWFWPMLESIDVVNVALETRNLPTQSVLTKDGKSITFSCNVCYRITDACRMFVAIQDFDSAVEAFAMVHLAGAIGTRTMAALKKDREALELELCEGLTAKVADWGAEIEWVGLTDLVDARSYRLFGSAGL